MRRLAGLMIAMGLLAMPALAQPLPKPETYTIRGEGPDGSPYSGTLEIELQRGGDIRMTWRVAGETIRGIGVVHDDVLAGAYLMDGRVGVIAYRILPDGRLEGPWSVGDGVGVERGRLR